MTVRHAHAGPEVADVLVQVGPIDDDGYAALHRHYWSFLVGLAAKQGARDPEGLASATLIEGFASLGRLEKRNEFSFQLYLRRILTAKVAREYRTQGHEQPGVDEIDGAVPDPADSAVDEIWLHDLIEELTPDQQVVIRGRFFEDLSANQLGRKLGKDPNAIYQIQHRAIARLRKAVLIGLALVLVVVGLAAIRQVVQTRIETTPIERRDETDPPPPDVPDSPPTSLQRADGERLTSRPDDEGRQTLLGPDSEVTEGATTSIPEPSSPAARGPAASVVAGLGSAEPASTSTSTTVPAAPLSTSAPTAAAPTATTPLAPQGPPPPAPNPTEANDDSVTVDVGQPVWLNVTSNDAPSEDVDSVVPSSNCLTGSGLTLISDGRITGMATESGVYPCPYTLMSTSGSTATAVLTVTVSALPTPPATGCQVRSGRAMVFVAGSDYPDTYEFLDADGNLVFAASLASAFVIQDDSVLFGYGPPTAVAVRVTVDGMAPSAVTNCTDR